MKGYEKGREFARYRLAARDFDLRRESSRESSRFAMNSLEAKKALCAYVARSRGARGTRRGFEAEIAIVDVKKARLDARSGEVKKEDCQRSSSVDVENAPD